MKAAQPKAPPDPNKIVPEAVNKTGGIETDDGRTLFGLDAEIYLKLKAKEDPEWESKVGAWIEKVLGKPLIDSKDIHTSCKDGVILCELVNKIQPGTIKKINPTTGMLKHLAERDNINLYLKACYTLGIDNSSMFTIADLHAKRGIATVLSNIATLSHIAHSKFGCTVEPLGPGMSASIVEHSQRSFKWSVDTSYLSRIMADEAVEEGQAALEGELQRTKEREEEERYKLSKEKTARRLLKLALEREKLKVKDYETELGNLVLSVYRFEEVMANFSQMKNDIDKALAELQRMDSRDDLKIKLLDELKLWEAKYDDQSSAFRDALIAAAAGDEAGEAAVEAQKKKEELDRIVSEKTEAEAKVKELTPIVDALMDGFIEAEERLNDAMASYQEKEKVIQNKI